MNLTSLAVGAPDVCAAEAGHMRQARRLVMPGLTGFDVVQELRDHPETREIPILIFTVKDLSAEERQQLKGSVHAVVTKGAAGDLLRELERVRSVQGRSEGTTDGRRA